MLNTSTPLTSATEFLLFQTTSALADSLCFIGRNGQNLTQSLHYMLSCVAKAKSEQIIGSLQTKCAATIANLTDFSLTNCVKDFVTFPQPYTADQANSISFGLQGGLFQRAHPGNTVCNLYFKAGEEADHCLISSILSNYTNPLTGDFAAELITLISIVSLFGIALGSFFCWQRMQATKKLTEDAHIQSDEESQRLLELNI